VETRLLSRIQIDQSTGCWNWQGHLSVLGYGKISRDGRLQTVHRVSYEIKYGKIPSGLEPNHKCRNRACVNPDHIEAVTHQLNIWYARGITSTHWGCGHEKTSPNSRTTSSGSIVCGICARTKERERYRKDPEKYKARVAAVYYRKKASR
jgi:hypothetical protein